MGAQWSQKGQEASRQCVKMVGKGTEKLKAAVRRRKADPRGAAVGALLLQDGAEGALSQAQAEEVWDLYAAAPGSEVMEAAEARAMLEHAVAAMTEWVLDHALDHCEPHELPKGFKDQYKSKDAEKIAASLLESLRDAPGEAGDGADGLLSRESFFSLVGRPFQDLLTEHDVFLSPEEEGQDAAAAAPPPASRSSVVPSEDDAAAAAAAAASRQRGERSAPASSSSEDEPGFDFCADAFEVPPAGQGRKPKKAPASSAGERRARAGDEQRLAAQLHSQFVSTMGDDDLIL